MTSVLPLTFALVAFHLGTGNEAGVGTAPQVPATPSCCDHPRARLAVWTGPVVEHADPVGPIPAFETRSEQLAEVIGAGDIR